jgi:dTMP kinase
VAFLRSESRRSGAGRARRSVTVGRPDGGADPTDATAEVRSPDPLDRPDRHVRLFGTHEFFRLWLVQVVSSTGDWLGFSALILLAVKVGGDAGAGAISLVVAARLVPGFFFGPLAGVFVDRWDRKRTMVACDLGRAAVVATLPFVDSVLGLVLASLVLEVFTLLWSPAKDATVPNLVPPDHLTTANSLSLAAAYGTFPLASLLFALLAGISTWLSGIDALAFLDLDQMSLALYVDVATFLFGALMIRGLALPRRTPPPRRNWKRIRRNAADPLPISDGLTTWGELKEGWHYAFLNPTVRAVNIGMATGVMGGGMLIPLGAVFSTEVLGAGAAGYGVFISALGFGVATGVVLISVLQRRLPKVRVFTSCLFVAGISLVLAASASSLAVVSALVFVMGMAVGPVYVVGFALLHEEVVDDLRGRVFSALNTLVRSCILASMVIGPLLAAGLGELSTSLVGGVLEAGPASVAVPGVRLALWFGGLVIVAAGFLSLHAIRRGARVAAAPGAQG